MGLRAKLTFAFTIFAVLGIGAFGAALLSRFWGAAMQVIADRQVLVGESRAHLIRDEITGLELEMARLSRLAEIDLGDNDLEPEKRVLRIGRKDEPLLSLTIVLVDAAGRVLWAEPSPPPHLPPVTDLVRASLADGRPHSGIVEGRILVVSALKGGGGALVGFVDSKRQRLLGGVEGQLGHDGWARLVNHEGAVVASTGAPAFPIPREAQTVQRWIERAGGRRWLATVTQVGTLDLRLEMVQAADELDDPLARPFRTLVGILAAELAFAIAAGLLLAQSLGKLEVVQAELFESQRLAAMGRTAAAIAHELKNALNGMSVAVDLLAEGVAPPETLGAVRGQLREEVARLRGITDDLTFFSGPARLDRNVVDLNELVRRAVTVLADRIAEEKVVVTTDLDGGGGGALQVEADADKLLGVLINLGQNAVEATDPSAFGDPLSEPPYPRERRVRIATRARNGLAEVEVTDNGAGIPPEARGRLFQPFFTTKRTGTGLGLAIGRKVVEAHGGEISAADAPGGGATFRITIPRNRPA